MTSAHYKASQPYELFMFARKHGLAVDCARAILDIFGADRRGADRVALAFKLTLK